MKDPSLSLDQWQEVKRLVDAVIELGPGAREAYLGHACPGTGPIRASVDALLSADRSGTFEKPPVQAAEFLRAGAAVERTRTIDGAPREGRRVGPYRLARKIGAGGMGEVYYAVREADFVQKVAIKLLRRPIAEHLLQRFNTERRILAALEHPNVAKLLDGGTSEEGDPYLVLEYIEGKPVLEHCDAARLTVDERLALFRKLCSAVHFAHQNLVVHRDIKPSNVVVTDTGEPKLLDFGIAKLLGPLMRPESRDVTRSDQRVMTPQYASPEQVQGQSISTASDVYSLGVLLYQLVSGRHPYWSEIGSPSKLVDVVCHQDHPPPSRALDRENPRAELGEDESVESIGRARATTPNRLRRHLRGDLDNIVMRAMRREARDRYLSAAALSEDIGRFLAGHPVAASKGTLWYSARKFVSRHRTAVVAAALVALALGAGVVGTSVGLVRATRAERLASSEAAVAEQVVQFLVALFEVSDPGEARGNSITAREILDRGALRIETELSSQPEVQARLMDTMGTVFLKLGLYDRAGALLEAAVDQRRRTLGDVSPTLAGSLARLATVYRQQARFGDAESLYRRALSIYEAAFGPDDPRIASTLNELGQLALVHQSEERYAEAEAVFQRVLAIRVATVGERHPDTATTLQDLAVLYRFQGKYEAAEGLFVRALDIFESQYGAKHPDVGKTLNNLGLLYDSQQRFDDAVSTFRRALAVYEAVQPGHVNVGYALHNWASTCSKQGKLAEAEPLAERALAIFEESLGRDHPNVARVLNNLSYLYLKQQRFAEAEAALVRALDIYQRALGADHPVTTAIRANLEEVREQL